MKEIIKEKIKIVFGTSSNILLKFNLASLITGILLSFLAFMIPESENTQAYHIFQFISTAFFAIFLISIDRKSTIDIVGEFVRFLIFIPTFIYSMNFCINYSTEMRGISLGVYSLFSCIGIFFGVFYLISKFIDIFEFIKNIFHKFKESLFGSNQPTPSKVKTLLENITTFLVALTGFGVSIKAILEFVVEIFI